MANPVKKIKLNVTRGGTFEQDITVTNPADDTPLTITGYTAKLQIRGDVGSALLHEATTSDDLTVSGTDVTVKFPTAATKLWTFDAARYDLFIAPPSAPTEYYPIARGTVVVHDAITEF